jgi:hypothetical protein
MNRHLKRVPESFDSAVPESDRIPGDDTAGPEASPTSPQEPGGQSTG